LKFNESQVAQSLELLADFVVDMEVAGMQARQRRLKAGNSSNLNYGTCIYFQISFDI
jgi:hypothetical protein